MNTKLEKLIQNVWENIYYLQNKKSTSTCLYEKLYFEEIIKHLFELIKHYDAILYRNEEDFFDLKTFTKNELKQYDGKDGKKAYVAVKGVVYDVSKEQTWLKNVHFGLVPGNDLTSEFERCHIDLKVLKNLPKVGMLIDESLFDFT